MADSRGRQDSGDRIRAIASRLACVHPATRKVRRDPLDELILTILSQNTSDANCYRGWEALRDRYADWEAVLAAPEGQLEETIRPAGLARQKSATILSVLERLRSERGRLSLNHLDQMKNDEAIDYLTSFKGVGVKTAACVLCFAMGRDVIPVDTHVHRLAIRRIVNEIVPPELRYKLHVLLIGHGRKVCDARRPKCDACVVSGLCPKVGIRESA
jgi:endonuclease-3